METASAVAKSVCHSLERSRLITEPYKHWLLKDVLPPQIGIAIIALPFTPPLIGDTMGKRETHNGTRTFFAGEIRERFHVCRDFANAMQGEAVVRKVEETCGISLRGSFLRIEYCQDTDGFWLEPHTDIREKLLTMLVYLSTGLGATQWGTDVYDEDLNYVATAPSEFNAGLIFIPGANTWHGFRKRPIDGVRRTLIINYVTDWKDRSQLAFPDRPVYR